jgi:hypothetical protein
VTLFSIAANAVNVPWWDEWAMVPLFRGAASGTLHLGAFWVPWNEHRPVFPRAFLFGLAYVTHWDTRVELYVNFALAVATFAVLVLWMRRTLDRTPFVIASIVASVVFFSLVQWENWLWGLQMEWFLSNLAAVGALWALTVTVDRSPRRGLLIGAGCALVATFSFGQGLLLWPVGLALLILRRRPWRTWAVLSVATPVVYFANWHEVAGHPSRSLFLEHPLQFADFVLRYLWRGLAVSTATGRLVGGAMLVAFLAAAAYVVARRHDAALVNRSALWLGTGLYMLGAAVITAISRLGVGVEYAAQSRYMTAGALLAIATMALLFTIARSDHIAAHPITPAVRRAAMAAVAIPLLLAAIVNSRSGSDEMDKRGMYLSAFAACTRHVQAPTDPCMDGGVPRPDGAVPSPDAKHKLFERITFLRSKGWAGY